MGFNLGSIFGSDIGNWAKDVVDSFFGNPSQAWDRFKNGRTNELNKEVADNNLAYQKEYNELMQANYEDEKSYNRALQQQLFEREDTAIERQVQSLSKLGINPLSQNMQGLGAGSPVGNPNPSGVQPLHNNYQHQDVGILPMLSALSSLASTVNGVSSGTYERDALALENDRKYLENVKFANELGINYIGPETMYTKGNYRKGHIVRDDGTNVYDTPQFGAARYSGLVEGAEKNREFDHKRRSNLYDTDSPQVRLIKDLGNLDFVSLAESIMTKFAKTGDNIGKKFGKDFGAENALSKFFSLFY